jgi:hypothetical protein
MEGLFCKISPSLLIEGVLRDLQGSYFENGVVHVTVRIDGRTSIRSGGRGRDPAAGPCRVTGRIATIFFPYDEPSSCVLFMRVVLRRYACGWVCDVKVHVRVGREERYYVGIVLSQLRYVHSWREIM